MKLRKIALSLLLIVSMMVAMTGSALAAEPVTVSTLDELTAALAAGGEIVIGANITVPNATTLTIPSGKTVTLDLNGKTISQEDSTGTSTALVTNKGTLTIKDSSGNDSGKLSFTSTTPGAPMEKTGTPIPSATMALSPSKTVRSKTLVPVEVLAMRWTITKVAPPPSMAAN